MNLLSFNKGKVAQLENELQLKDAALKKQANTQVKTIVKQIAERRTIWRKEINDWQMAREAFYDDYNPTTWDLQEVYHDVMLDDQLTTVTGDRKLRVTNKEFVIRKPDGSVDEDKTKMLQEEWFYNLIDIYLESIFRGYSLPWLKVGRSLTGKVTIRDVEDIPRGWVSPHNRLLLENEHIPTVGVELDRFGNELLYGQMYGQAGLLEKAAPLTMLKRHSWGSWDEFEQIFGIPLRVAKYAMGNDKMKSEIAGWMEEMGSAAYGIFPKETDIEIVENSQTDAFNVFLKKIERVDQGLSKMILHQTGTTDEKAFVGSAEVHQDTLGEVTASDERKTLLFLNNKLLPALRHWGYPIADDETIGIKKTTNPEHQIKIDGVLLKEGYKLSREYIERTYGVELEDEVQEPDPKPEGEEDDKKEPKPEVKKKRLNNS